MSKIKSINLSIKPIDKREPKYQSIVDGIAELGNVESGLVIATALVYNSINIHKGVFSTPTRADVDDVKLIANELLFELNEVLPVNIELIKGEIVGAIDRLIPDIDTEKLHMVTFDRLFNTANVVDSKIVDSIDSQLYFSDAIFSGIRMLFSVAPEEVVYVDEDKAIYTK